MVVLARIKMGLVQLILSAGTYHGSPKTHRETCLKIHSGPVSSEVRDQELGHSNLCEDLIAYLLIMVNSINPDRLKAAISNCEFYSSPVRLIHFCAEPHGDKASSLNTGSSAKGFQVLPSFNRDRTGKR